MTTQSTMKGDTVMMGRKPLPEGMKRERWTVFVTPQERSVLESHLSTLRQGVSFANRPETRTLTDVFPQMRGATAEEAIDRIPVMSAHSIKPPLPVAEVQPSFKQEKRRRPVYNAPSCDPDVREEEPALD